MIPWFETEDPIDLPPKPCIICGKMLVSVDVSWRNFQPYNGGELRLVFSFGSKHDLCGEGVFRGVICDDCGSNLIDKMELHPQ